MRLFPNPPDDDLLAEHTDTEHPSLLKLRPGHDQQPVVGEDKIADDWHVALRYSATGDRR
ncbi:MAG: hypothetical protein OXG37_15095 [Actinomycetia bacterium]|nr:hypothetical protein [Actinomycetes bacterium]